VANETLTIGARWTGWPAGSPGGWKVVSMAAGARGRGTRPRRLPSQLSGEMREFKTRADRRQVRENDLSGADRGGLPL
jgi:hypothetical protein